MVGVQLKGAPRRPPDADKKAVLKSALACGQAISAVWN